MASRKELKRTELKRLLGGCSIKEAIEISHQISPEFESVFNKYYILGKTLRAISKEDGTSFQNINYRKNKSVSEIVRIFKDKEFIAETREAIERIGNDPIELRIRKRTSEIMQNLDYQIEVEPYLDEYERYIFKNFMIDFNEDEYFKLPGEKYYQKNAFLLSKNRHILNLVKKILLNKIDQEKFFNLVGGEAGLSEILELLTEDEITLIDEAILEIAPATRTNFRNKYGMTSNELIAAKESLFGFVEEFNRRKQDCKDFVEKNGGELFLINEFGSTLNDAEFFVLTNTMTDYYYRTKKDLSLEVGQNESFVCTHEFKIKERLERYNQRKKSVGKIIEGMGGDSALIEFCKGLNEKELGVLFEYILSYAPCTITKLEKNYNLTRREVIKIIDSLESSLKAASIVNESV